MMSSCHLQTLTLSSLQMDACNSEVAGPDVWRTDSHEGTLTMEVRLGESIIDHRRWRGVNGSIPRWVNRQLEKCMQQSGLGVLK